MSTSPKDLTRRDVIRAGMAAAALGAVHSACSGSTPASAPAAPKPAAPPAKKKILILGGTGFLGPKTVGAAIARGHTVTIFNRGKREKLLPLEFKVEHLYGNRDPELPADDEKGPDGKLLHPDATPKGLEQLVGRKWDVVIDNSGYYPRMVKASAEMLAKNASQYIYISSISAYDENPAKGGDETTRLATLADPTVETMGDEFENYGGLKVLCERAGAGVVRRARHHRAPRLHRRARRSRPIDSRTGRSASRAAAMSSRPARRTIRCSGSTCATSPSGW